MKTLFFAFTLLIFSIDSNSQNRLFDDSDILSINIVANLSELFKDVNPENAKYHQGILTYIDNEGNSQNIKIKLKTRGIFRRSRENCNTPPLTVKFIDDSTKFQLFGQAEKLKLVNVCNRKRGSYQQYLIKEYLAYKSYNIFSEYSFKVRMVRIIYVDINNSIAPFESMGFFIEDMESLNRRTRSVNLSTLGIIQEAVDRSKMDVMAMFQYIIGNTDWSVPKLHNIKLVVKDSSLIPIAIPYDFDFCGFVNPPYTKPPEIIPISHVSERFFRGSCRTPYELESAISLYKANKDRLYNLILEDTLLTVRNKKYVYGYIDKFYRILDNPRLVKREFYDNCRKY